LTEQVEQSAQKKIRRKKPIDTSILIPSGSTLLNLACSDDPFGAFALGRIVTMPGGSVSGKTMLALTTLAMCTADARFDKYDLIYDDGEESLSMDIEYLFGEELNVRLAAPGWDEEVDEPLHSETIQDFKSGILTRCGNPDKPFIYILDSLDSLTSDEELEREYKIAIAKAKSAEAVKELKGSYKTEKARHIGEALRMINGSLKKTKSALFIVQQERDKIGTSFGKASTTSGGRAPYFYSTHQLWFNNIGTLTKEVNYVKLKYGIKVRLEVSKNKINGKRREIDFNIYEDYGVDDIASCVDFLVKFKHWEKEKETIIAHDLDMKGGRPGLIEKIEKAQAEYELQKITGKVWNDIEESIRLGRNRNFG